MKCIFCAAIDMNTETDYVYRGYSTCQYHAYCLVKDEIKAIMELQKEKWRMGKRDVDDYSSLYH